MGSSALSHRISVRLLQDIVSGAISAGDHVGAHRLAERYGVSRTPVRGALSLLEDKGVLQRQVNRGYYVSGSVPISVRRWLKEEQQTAGDDYQRFADDWLTDRLPEEVTEQFLRQRYGWTKAKTGDLLVRAAREGWAERKEGYGWRFLPVAKTPEAFDQIYRLRMAIEPTAMLEPTFTLERKVLAELRRDQERMLELNFHAMPDESLLESGAVFHEALAKLSGNPFFLMALQRVNRMRRLMEYRAEVNHERLVEQCSEHLEILDLLDSGNVVDASYLMRQHLGGALKRKSPLAWSWAADVNPQNARPQDELDRANDVLVGVSTLQAKQRR